MLIQFRAENFLSIKGSVVLSLLASKDKEHPKHLIVNGSKRYLKSAGIYGANASGKSNVLHAFWFMVNYVLTSHNQQLHKAIERSPFKFDRETPVRPSSFEVIFTANGIRYAYGFSVTDKVVIEEWHFQQGIGRIHAAAKGGGLIAMDLSYLFYPAQCWAFGSVWCEAG